MIIGLLLIVGIVVVIKLDLFYVPKFNQLTKPKKCKCTNCCKEDKDE